MENRFTQRLSDHLLKYSALTVAMAAVAEVNGQIDYSPVDPDINIMGTNYLLDMNNDGTAEANILQRGNDLYINPWYTGEILAPQYNGYKFTLALGYSAIISQGVPTWYTPNSFLYQYMNFNSCSQGNWCDGTDKYLGIRFNIAGQPHYGWARLSVSSAPGSVAGVILKDYAYNTVALESITAGQVLGIEENIFSELKIVSINKTIAFYNLPQTTIYKLYNLIGQSVLEGKTESNIHVIEANLMSSGVYIIELEDHNSKSIIRKKVVL